MPIFRDSKRIIDLVSPAGRRVTHLIRDGKIYYRAVGRETVRITLGPSTQARDQFRAVLADRGLDHTTITEIPFDINLFGTGSVEEIFYDCSSLTHAPDLDTISVRSMRSMFYGCSSLTHVPDMNTSRVRDTRTMFTRCSSLTDGNVRLIGKHTNVSTSNMINLSGLTREPFYDSDGNPI